MMYKKKWGDRSDGHRLNNVDTIYQLVPYIMKTRLDSQVFFEESLDYSKIESMLHKLRREGHGNIRTMDVLIAATLRTMAQRPRLNRFVCGSKIYARNSYTVSIAIKRDLSDNGEETTVKVDFDPTDSLFDVVEKMEKVLSDNKQENSENNTDVFAGIIGRMPSFLLKMVVNFIMWLDRCGILPKSIIKISPFHSSFFITNIGSIGLKSVYHHLYAFGTTSLFLALGTKEKELALNDENVPVEKRVMKLKVVIDERISDGFYNAVSMKVLKRILRAPETLLEKLPADKVVLDDGIQAKRKKREKGRMRVEN